MKKIIVLIISILIPLLLIVLFPKNLEDVVVIDCSNNKIKLYTNGQIKEIKSSNTYPKFTVLNLKYNMLGAFNIKEVSPYKERIMIKTNDYYDLEKSGKLKLSSNASYYIIDKNNNIAPCTSSKVIIGKSNIKSFLNKNNKLNTFLIYPIDYSNIRVAISTNEFSSLYHEKLLLNFNDNYTIYSLKESFPFRFKKDSIISIEPKNNGLALSDGVTETFVKERLYIKSDSTCIKNIKRGYPQFNPIYKGILELTATEKGICVINELPIEDYLCKVVPSEMPTSGGLESLKCQAIAARTYCISDMLNNRFENLGFHVDDSTQSQVYNNVSENALAKDAIYLTKGTIMTYDNVPIDAKYYSTSSGTGAPYSDIWFEANDTSEFRPYLTSQNYLEPKSPLPSSEDDWLKFYKSTTYKAYDSNYPYFRWNITISKKALGKSLNKSLNSLYDKRKEYIDISSNGKKLKKLPELKNLKAIQTIKRGNSGNIISISYVFDNATIIVKSDYIIRSSLKFGSSYTDENISLMRHNGTPVKNLQSIPSSFFSVENINDNFIFYGGGYGHGVGMSQNGAMELSKKGLSFKEILDVYYKNITLKNIYEY